MRVACLLLVAVIACRENAPPARPVLLTTKIPLRYHPPAGAAYHYLLEQHARFGPDSAAAADTTTLAAMTLALTQQIGTPAADGIPVTITLDSSRVAGAMLSADAAAAAAGRLRGLRVDGVLDDRLRFVREDFASLSRLPPLVREQIELGVRAAALSFPQEPVGAGDSWTFETTLPLAQLVKGMDVSVTSKVTVKAITVTGTDTTVALAVETGVPQRPLQFDFGGQPPVEIRLSGGLSGDQVFSLTRGTVVRGAVGGTVHLAVTGGLYQGLAMRVEQRATTRLVETPTGP